MTEILLTLVILSFLVYHIYYVREVGKKEAYYIKALLAKDLPELVEADGPEKSEEPPQSQVPDLVLTDQLDDEAFDSFITPTKE